MRVFLFSDNIRTLDESEDNSYTDRVPREMATSLSRLLTTLYIVTNQHSQWGGSRQYPNVRFIGTTDLHLLFGDASGEQTVCFFCGYDPVKILHIKKLCRKHGAKAVTYIYDSHKLAADHLSAFKKLYVHVRYSIGMRLVNILDGVVVYTSVAHRILRLKVPYLFSRIGIRVPQELPPYKTRSDSYTMLYAGGLYRHNGLDIAAAAMSRLDIPNAHLIICGGGPQQAMLAEAARKNPNIHLHPFMPRYELLALYRKTDLLLNFRDPRSRISPSAISFPSKILEYFSMGVPVLTSDFTDDIDLPSISYVVREFTPEGIAKTMREAYEDTVPRRKTERALAYVRKEHNWDTITDELYVFFKSLF